MRTGRTTIGIAWMTLAVAACGDDGGARDVGVAPSQPRTVVEGDYGPIAQYLVDNAHAPVPSGASDDGGDDGGGDSGAEPEAPNPCNGFACSDGLCLDPSWRCDQIVDCEGGEDEADCAADPEMPGAPACNGFACDDGVCIDADWQCDEYVDCAGGEDEASCGDAQTPVLAAAPAVQQGEAIDCIAEWTATGSGAGLVAGELISKGCIGGGVVVGMATAGGGFAAATVCFAADVSQLDAVVGGIFGAIAGLVGGVATCEGNALAEAGAMLQSLFTGGAVPTYEVEASDDAGAMRCGVPLVVPLSGNEPLCEHMHGEMTQFETTQQYNCNVDIGNIGNDPASIAAACDDIRTRFDNAAKLADLRLDIGRACYDNGNVGPMGNSDFGHQFQWCSVHQAMQRCVTQAQHQKLQCDLSQTMAQHFLPGGCENMLACQ